MSSPKAKGVTIDGTEYYSADMLYATGQWPFGSFFTPSDFVVMAGKAGQYLRFATADPQAAGGWKNIPASSLVQEGGQPSLFFDKDWFDAANGRGKSSKEDGDTSDDEGSKHDSEDEGEEEEDDVDTMNIYALRDEVTALRHIVDENELLHEQDIRRYRARNKRMQKVIEGLMLLLHTD